jgi:hypothetical protein
MRRPSNHSRPHALTRLAISFLVAWAALTLLAAAVAISAPID